MYSCRLARIAARRREGCGRRLVRHASGSPGKPSSANAAAGGVTQKAAGVKAVALKSLGIGTSAGVLGSLVGMGGGFVAIPSLTGWLRLTQHQAHGTSLGAVFATGAAGSAAYALSGHVDASSAAAMAVAGMAAAHVGARCTTGISPPSLKLALGVLMIAVSPLLPLREKITSIGKPCGTPDEEGASEISPERSTESSPTRVEAEEDIPIPAVGSSPTSVGPWRSTVLLFASSIESFDSTVGSLGEKIGSLVSTAESPPQDSAVSETAASGNASGNNISAVTSTVAGGGRGGSLADVFGPTSGKVVRMFAIGLGSGFLAGVFGVGGGVVTVPALSLATDLGHKEVLGTSLAAMVLPALVGSVTHFKQGNLIPRIAVPLALGTGVGAFVGGKHAARHLDETSLKWAFSCLMVVMGARTVVAARTASAASAAAAAAAAAIARRV